MHSMNEEVKNNHNLISTISNIFKSHIYMTYKRWRPQTNYALRYSRNCDFDVSKNLDCHRHDGMAIIVRDALDAYLTPILLQRDFRAAGAFKAAWQWSLSPSLSAFASLAILLSAIAKHHIWVTFTARVFGGAVPADVVASGNSVGVISPSFHFSNLQQLYRSSSALAGTRTVQQVIDDSKREFISTLRYLEANQPSRFARLKRFAIPLLALAAL